MPNGGTDITEFAELVAKYATPDPITGAMTEIAKSAIKMGIEMVATKLAEAWGCQPSDKETREIFTSTMCLIVRGAAGLDEKEWKQNITSKLEQITSQLTVIDTKIDQINNKIEEVLKQLAIVKMGIDEIIRGMSAYDTITIIQTRYNQFNSEIKELQNNVANIEEGNKDQVQQLARETKVRLEKFYEDLNSLDIPEKIDRIITALTQSIADKPSLLRNIITQAETKLRKTKLEGDSFQITKLFEAYVSNIIVDLDKAYVLYSHLAQFVHMTMNENTLSPTYTVEHWHKHYSGQKKKLLDAFNSELERMILMLRTENMGHITPYFFDYSDENAFASADRFTSLMLGEPLGIRGRIFSMGDKFDGKIKITLADHSIKEIIGEKFSVSTGKTVDWWETKANTNAVYDTVHFSDIWNVYRYHFSEGIKKGTYPIQFNNAPYVPGAILVETYNGESFEKITDNASVTNVNLVEFGSFTEIQRAGGAFAWLSGAWKDAVIEDNHLGGGAKDEYRRNDGYAKVNKLSFKNDRWKELYYKHYMGGFGMQDYPENAPTLRSYDVMLFEMVAQAEGFVNWNASSNDPNFIKRNYTVYIEANKTVSSPEARKVKFSVKFIDNSQSFSFHLSNSRKPTQCFTQISFITGWLTTHGCNIQSKFELKLKEETNHIEKFCSLNTDKNNSINDTKELTDNPYNAFTIFNFDGNNRTFCARASVNYDIECSGTFPSGYGGTAKFAIDRISLEPA